MELAPRIGVDTFLKLYTHGAQERNSSALLCDVLETAFNLLVEEANRRECSIHFVTARQMYLAIDAIRQRRDPLIAVHSSQTEGQIGGNPHTRSAGKCAGAETVRQH